MDNSLTFLLIFIGGWLVGGLLVKFITSWKKRRENNFVIPEYKIAGDISALKPDITKDNTLLEKQTVELTFSVEIVMPKVCAQCWRRSTCAMMCVSQRKKMWKEDGNCEFFEPPGKVITK